MIIDKYIEWHDNDNIRCEYYHKEGNINYWHRIDGPARILYDKNGDVKRCVYYINDIRYTKEEYEVIEEIVKLLEGE